MAIDVTEAAAKQIQSSLESRGKGMGIRLGITTTGCSGFAYVMEFVDQLKEEDNVFDEHGVKLIVDDKSLVYLDGTQVDFVKQGLNEGFEFSNPNSKGECGCGESFSV
jgi:iron-sulfur cluster assembly protein